MAPENADPSPDEVIRGASCLAIDSRAVKDGGVFIALRGTRTDGHEFIDDAIARGARAIVMEEPRVLPEGVRGFVVSDSARMLSRIADAFYGSPAASLKMVGVTGTNGKTTTTQMIAAILNAARFPTAVIGTLGASFGERDWPLAHTTPLANELHALLAQLREAGAQGVAMEVSSHGLALHRVADIAFDIGVLTNISRDHLDFHKTFEAYVEAKRSLFTLSAVAVLNRDDAFGAKWAAEKIRPRTLTYSLHPGADVVAQHIALRADGSTFEVEGVAFRIPLPGRFNVANALAAIAATREFGVGLEIASAALRALAPVAGRMEHFGGAGIDVVVDYAHTPDALENALRSLRETSTGKLAVVFGCGGDRDRGKRPQMGAIAAEYADAVIVTSDNPRTENPQTIADEIVAGLGGRAHTLMLDRRVAIQEAIRAAAPGDVILVAGKGHEPYQIIGEKILPFDDRAVVREALEARARVAS